MPGFLFGCWGLNSGPHACSVSTLQTKVSSKTSVPSLSLRLCVITRIYFLAVYCVLSGRVRDPALMAGYELSRRPVLPKAAYCLPRCLDCRTETVVLAYIKGIHYKEPGMFPGTQEENV